MEWLEADPLPEECMTCQEEDCYNCDHAGKRWYLAPEAEAKIIQKLAQQAASRQKRSRRNDGKSRDLYSGPGAYDRPP